jgi:hypothetical protein
MCLLFQTDLMVLRFPMVLLVLVLLNWHLMDLLVLLNQLVLLDL